jgi:hypothetical protein
MAPDHQTVAPAGVLRRWPENAHRRDPAEIARGPDQDAVKRAEPRIPPRARRRVQGAGGRAIAEVGRHGQGLAMILGDPVLRSLWQHLLDDLARR